MKTNRPIPEWPAHALAVLEEARRVAERDYPGQPITDANLCPPRPYRNEYDRGDPRWCLTYTVGYRHVYQHHWRIEGD